jgi:Ca2+-binding RTX toxin-like protein
MSFVANIVKDRPNDGARVTENGIRPAANEVNNPANPTGGLDTEGTPGKDEITGTNQSDVIRGDDGRDNLNGRARKDVISGEGGSDAIRGGGGNDALFGGDGDDAIKGGGGKDLITGDRGSDKIMGGKGDDLIVGGEGDDLLRGGQGSDILEGGAGADTFLFKGNDFGGDFFEDIVADFVRGIDTVSFESGGTRVFTGMSVGNDYVINVINKLNNLSGTITILGQGGKVADVSEVTASQLSSMFG